MTAGGAALPRAETATATLEILERLVAFPSVSSAPETGIADWIGDFLAARGFEVHRLRDGGKTGLFARLGPGDRPGVMLSGHTDVVPVEGQPWTGDPFRLRRAGNRLLGRGAADMKGFLACMLALGERAAARPLAEPLKLAFSYDEELGCIGLPRMLPFLAGTIGTPRLCIVGEPTGMEIALGHKGKIAFRATCHGTSGHSAMAPDYLNALHLAADLLGALRAMQSDLAKHGARDGDYGIPYATVHAGRLQGGTALNIVPDRATLDFEIRHLAGQAGEDLIGTVREAVAGVVESYRPKHPEARIDLDVVNAYPGLATPREAEGPALLADLLPGAAFTKVAFGTEAGHFDAAGIPSVVCGPGFMEQGHKPDEFIDLDQLAACDAFCDRLLNRLSRA